MSRDDGEANNGISERAERDERITKKPPGDTLAAMRCRCGSPRLRGARKASEHVRARHARHSHFFFFHDTAIPCVSSRSLARIDVRTFIFATRAHTSRLQPASGNWHRLNAHFRWGKKENALKDELKKNWIIIIFFFFI